MKTADRITQAHPDVAVDVAEVDAFDEGSVTAHAAAAVEAAGKIDVVFNAVGINAVQGVPLLDIPLAEFQGPVTAFDVYPVHYCPCGRPTFGVPRPRDGPHPLRFARPSGHSRDRRVGCGVRRD